MNMNEDPVPYDDSSWAAQGLYNSQCCHLLQLLIRESLYEVSRHVQGGEVVACLVHVQTGVAVLHHELDVGGLRDRGRG